MNKLKEVIFTKEDSEFQVIGIYVKRGETQYQGDDSQPAQYVLGQGESYYKQRSEAKKLAYANSVPFVDLVSTTLVEELAKMKKGA